MTIVADSKPRVLALIDHYLPGHKMGGPIRSLANTVDRLGGRLDFFILTRDRDFTDRDPYPGVALNSWNRVGNALVYYAPPRSLTPGKILRLIRAARPAVLYLNSCFSSLTIRVLLLRRAGLLPGLPVVIAPLGMFSPGALQLKAFKKRAFIAAARRIGLYHDLTWHATSHLEADHIRQVVGSEARISIALTLPPGTKPGYLAETHRSPKEPGLASFVFLSLITPKKNLLFALESLAGLAGQVSLDIYGPIGAKNERYWARCRKRIATLPSNIQVTYRGVLPHEEVAPTLARYHFFLLSTLGENFGHAILEAFMAATPVLLSDGTPWRNLAARGVGWDLPLGDVDLWRRTLQECVDMDQSRYAQLSAAAHRFAVEWCAGEDVERQNLDLFVSASRITAAHTPAGSPAA